MLESRVIFWASQLIASQSIAQTTMAPMQRLWQFANVFPQSVRSRDCSVWYNAEAGAEPQPGQARMDFEQQLGEMGRKLEAKRCFSLLPKACNHMPAWQHACMHTYMYINACPCVCMFSRSLQSLGHGVPFFGVACFCAPKIGSKGPACGWALAAKHESSPGPSRIAIPQSTLLMFRGYIIYGAALISGGGGYRHGDTAPYMHIPVGVYLYTQRHINVYI